MALRKQEVPRKSDMITDEVNVEHYELMRPGDDDVAITPDIETELADNGYHIDPRL